VAEGTGGSYTGGTNDLRKPFQRLLDEADTHYQALYKPTGGVADGRLRKIEVKVAHPGWTVESRAGYYALPDLGGSWIPNANEYAALAALNQSETPHAFEFRAGTFQFGARKSGTRDALALEIPASGLTATAEPERAQRRFHITLLALVKNSNGQIVDKFSRDDSYEIPEDALESMKAGMLTYTRAFDLAGGHYTVETVVVDRESGKASASTLEFENDERPSVDLSSVVLVQRLEEAKGPSDATNPMLYAGKQVIPTLAPVLPPDAKPYAYFVVYPDKNSAEKPRVLVELISGGAVVAHQDYDLPAPDAAGAVPMMVTAATRPGRCQLRVSAHQGDAVVIRLIDYAVSPY
jgi:hypothetical protein